MIGHRAKEAVQQPMRGFPSWFLRVRPLRQGQMMNEAQMSVPGADWHCASPLAAYTMTVAAAGREGRAADRHRWRGAADRVADR